MYWIEGECLIQYEWCPYKKRRIHRNIGEMSYDYGGRDHSDVSFSQGMPRIAGNIGH